MAIKVLFTYVCNFFAIVESVDDLVYLFTQTWMCRIGKYGDETGTKSFQRWSSGCRRCRKGESIKRLDFTIALIQNPLFFNTFAFCYYWCRRCYWIVTAMLTKNCFSSEFFLAESFWLYRLSWYSLLTREYLSLIILFKNSTSIIFLVALQCFAFELVTPAGRGSPYIAGLP